jgi:hypothetical protein
METYMYSAALTTQAVTIRSLIYSTLKKQATISAELNIVNQFQENGSFVIY